MEILALAVFASLLAATAFSMCYVPAQPELCGRIEFDGPGVLHFCMERVLKAESVSEAELAEFVVSWRLSERGRQHIRYMLDNFSHFARAGGLIHRQDLAAFAKYVQAD